MISFKQFRGFFLKTSLIALLVTVITFSFTSAHSWAATSLIQLTSQPQTQMAFMNRAKAVSKDVEGKAQETLGNVTGDSKTKLEGKAKQAEAKARNTVEDGKNGVKKILD